MSFIAWIVLGLIAGLVGKKVIKNTGLTGWATLGMGVLGALAGGAVAALFGVEMDRFFSIASWAFAIVGAIAVLAAYRFVAENYLDNKPGTGEHEKKLN